MAFFKSSNPSLQEKAFQGTIMEGIQVGEEMTIKGTMNRFLFLFIMMLGSTFFSWGQFYKGSDPMPLLIAGVFGGLVIVLIMNFKKNWSPYLAPAYAILEGLFVGSISAYYDYAYKSSYPGLVMQAVGLTLVVTLVMYLLYRFRIIRVTKMFRSVLITATAAIFFFYLAQWIFYLIAGYNFAAFTNAASPLGIGFSIVVSIIAALNLLLNFDMIEKGAEMRVPKYMEWYGATGLLITIVWLYLELLRLLSKLNRN